MTTFITYCRVSTAKQGASGLGLEAQQQTIDTYLSRQDGRVIAQYVEVESGTKSDRPQLAAALHHCKLTKSVLLVAKLDRLSRDAVFILTLKRSKTDFIVCDFPEVNTLTLHIFAALAEYEREMISTRTKQALAAARARGQRLGNPGNLTVDGAARGAAAGHRSQAQAVREFTEDHGPVVAQYRSQGLTLRQTAAALNAADHAAPGGEKGKWTASAVSRVEHRWQATHRV